MPKEYVFWFHMIHKSAFAFLWNIPKQLVRISVSFDGIKSDGPIWTSSKDVFDISLPHITEVKSWYAATGQVGIVEITTQESSLYRLVPTNPFDPSLLVHSNDDEIKAFVRVVKALKENLSPDLDINPYIRQSQKKDKPAYVNTIPDSAWDSNISPWKYYYEYIPVSEDRKRRLIAKTYEIITWSLLVILVLGAFYAIYSQVIAK